MLDYLQRIGHGVGAWLYLIAGGLAFAEAAIMIGMVLPGESALLVAGYAAHQGWISLWVMVVVAISCAIVGDSVGYEVGRRFGPRVRASRFGMKVGERRWDAVDRFLHRHGGKSVLLGRMTALLRALVPGMAGMSRMPYLRTFLPWNVTGGVLWGGGCVLLGYGFAASLDKVARVLSIGPLPVLGVVIVVLVALHVRHKVRVRRRAAARAEAHARAESEVLVPELDD
jgi:membrane protein DedA with SNARE-associated domain